MSFSLPTHTDYDFIHGLPIVDIQPSEEEIKIANTIFKAKNVALNMQNDIKEVFLIAVLFVIFSSPQINNLILRFLPTLEKFPYAITGVKIVLIIILFWIVKNFALARKN